MIMKKILETSYEKVLIQADQNRYTKFIILILLSVKKPGVSNKVLIYLV